MADQAPNQPVMDEFRRRHGRQAKLVAGIVLLSIMEALLVVDLGGSQGTMLALAGLAAMGGLLALAMLNWRCPACRRFLGRDTYPRFCPQCGVMLRELD